jgi:hypothetical protein
LIAADGKATEKPERLEAVDPCEFCGDASRSSGKLRVG